MKKKLHEMTAEELKAEFAAVEYQLSQVDALHKQGSIVISVQRESSEHIVTWLVCWRAA